jgi:hypothetical protein
VKEENRGYSKFPNVYCSLFLKRVILQQVQGFQEAGKLIYSFKKCEWQSAVSQDQENESSMLHFDQSVTKEEHDDSQIQMLKCFHFQKIQV